MSCESEAEAATVSLHVPSACTLPDVSREDPTILGEVISLKNNCGSVVDNHKYSSGSCNGDSKAKSNDNSKVKETSKTQNYNHSCFLCKTPFVGGLKVVHLVLNKPMQWSTLDPVSLLKCFGMQVPSLGESECSKISPVDVCGLCYIVVSDCDFLYPHMRSFISKILDLWPEKLKGFKMLCLNISFPDNSSSCLKRVPVEGGCSLMPLITSKCTSKQRIYKKNHLSQVELTFTYPDNPMLHSELSDEVNKISVDEGSGYRVKECSERPRLHELFTCGFCGMPFSSELEWSSHCTSVHKIREKWLSYDRQMVLKGNIMNEICQTNTYDGESKCRKHADNISSAERCKCHACDSDFDSKVEVVEHLQGIHDIIVESFVFYEKHRKKDDQQTNCEADLSELESKDGLSEDLVVCTEEEVTPGDSIDKKSDCENSTLRTELQHKSKCLETVNLKSQDSKRNVRKVYAPHWRCRICGMMFSSQNVLTNHKQQSHPDSARIIKRKILSDSSLESDEEMSLENKDASVASRKRKLVKTSSQLVNDDLGYCVVLKGDGQGGVIDHRVKLGEDSLQSNMNVGTVEDYKPRKRSVKDIVTCGMCGEEFGNHTLIAEHSCPGYENVSKSKSNEVVLLECKVCGRRLQGVNSMRTHMARSHGYPFKKRDRKYQCKICTFKTQVRSQFAQHMREKHKRDVEPPVKCPKCEKNYSAQYIARHIAIIHGSSDNKKYSCKFCTMKYHDLNYLKRHIYFDHANTKWKCQICGLEFDKYHRLQQHRVNAHGTEVHKCTDCGKEFKRKGDLTTHIKRSHVTKVPSVCTFCSKAYAEPTNLRIHLMKKHGVSWEDTLSKRYARHQQESSCLRRRDSKDPKPTQSSKKQDKCLKKKQKPNRKQQMQEHKDYEGNFMQSEHQNLDSVQHFSQGGNIVETRESIDICDVQEPQYDVEITVGMDNLTKVEEITSTGTESFIVIEDPN
ncbi:zinc finger protein 521-like [Macrobrachium nipponense]|uniref:zinc finger protein 521-like n=1 Tax=Macrobrachium nipponense TaxID=159736 RepID=UPI0030C860C3